MSRTSVLDRIVGSIVWKGVRKVLIDATFTIKDEILPDVKLLLDVYKISFGYGFKTWNVEAHPGLYDVKITGNFDSSIEEIIKILRAKYGGFLFESGFYSGENELNKFSLTIKHPECYRFSNGGNWDDEI